MMSLKSLFMVISMTISMISYMPEYVQAKNACEGDLNNFGYNGKLDHDIQYFDVGEKLKPIKSLRGYREFIDYIDEKIFSTNNDLVEIYCTTVEVLFNQGFTGVLPIDRLLTENKEELATNYMAFINGKPYSDSKQPQFVFDLIYEFSLQKQLITTDEGKACKEALSKMKYNGNFVSDVASFVKRNGKKIPEDLKLDKKEISFIERYEAYMNYAKFIVLFTDNNIKDVYCDLLAPLRDYKFNGEMSNDRARMEELNKDESHPLREEARMYNEYLDKVDLDIYKKLDEDVPKSLLANFGLYKLGQIMY